VNSRILLAVVGLALIAAPAATPSSSVFYRIDHVADGDPGAGVDLFALDQVVVAQHFTRPDLRYQRWRRKTGLLGLPGEVGADGHDRSPGRIAQRWSSSGWPEH
jgi:hypothetical protein